MRSFDPLRIRQPDYLLFGTALTLAGIGLVIIYSASSVVAMEQYKDAAYFLKRQLMWLAVSIAMCFLTMRVHYTTLRRFTFPLLFLSLVGLILVFAPGVGRLVGGARRWLDLGPITFQPAELAKLALVLYLANFLAGRGPEVRDFIRGFLPPLLIFGLMALLVVAQPSIGSVVMLGGITGLMLFLGGGRLLHLAMLTTATASVVVILIFKMDYALRRLLALFNPWADPQGAGFQIIQSLLAFGSGGLLGLGLGESRQKFFYLPERHTDFIFSILGEEMGLLGTGGVLILFLIFTYRGLRIAQLSPNRYASLLACGITASIAVQAILNIGVVIGLLPITGVPLPFLSYGGSSLLMTMASVGILMNLSQHIKHPSPQPSPPWGEGRGISPWRSRGAEEQGGWRAEAQRGRGAGVRRRRGAGERKR